MKPNFLEVIDINKKFGNINALKNVSLNVSKGEVICIIGPSGCGKSTLLRTVNWLTPPDSGKVILKGEIIGSDTGKMTFEQNRSLNEFRARIGMVFQQFNVWPHLNALENVVRAQIVVRKRMRDEAEKKAIKILNEVGLKDKIDEWPDNLSGGQKQRLAIARAVYSNSPILILDEATSSLDSKSEKLVQDAIDKLMINKTSIVIAHRLSTIQNANKIIVLDKGEIVEQGNHDQLTKNDSYYKKLIALQSFK